MSILDWPESERPRERLLNMGAAALSEAELLAIIFRIGCPGKSAVALASDTLSRFGSLQVLLRASCEQFCESPGLGKSKYIQLQAALELARRHLRSHLEQKKSLTGSADTKQYLIAKLRHQPCEIFACIYLDIQHRIIQYEELFTGSLRESKIYLRKVVQQCLQHNAAAVIFVHNHPEGTAVPSPADIAVTKDLQLLLGQIDIRVIDHIIIGEYETSSMAETGVI